MLTSSCGAADSPCASLLLSKAFSHFWGVQLDSLELQDATHNALGGYIVLRSTRSIDAELFGLTTGSKGCISKHVDLLPVLTALTRK